MSTTMQLKTRRCTPEKSKIKTVEIENEFNFVADCAKDYIFCPIGIVVNSYLKRLIWIQSLTEQTS